MRLTVSALLVLGTFGAMNVASASGTNYCTGSKRITDDSRVVKCRNTQRRSEIGARVSGGNPVALATYANGDMYLYYTSDVSGRDNLAKCQVTNAVEDFKMSGNSGDISVAYFIRGGELYDLRVSGSVSGNRCPTQVKANLSKKAKDLGLISGSKVQKIRGKYKYKINPSNSAIVGMALIEGSGHVLMWSDGHMNKAAGAGMDAFNRVDNAVKADRGTRMRDMD